MSMIFFFFFCHQYISGADNEARLEVFSFIPNQNVMACTSSIGPERP